MGGPEAICGGAGSSRMSRVAPDSALPDSDPSRVERSVPPRVLDQPRHRLLLTAAFAASRTCRLHSRFPGALRPDRSRRGSSVEPSAASTPALCVLTLSHRSQAGAFPPDGSRRTGTGSGLSGARGDVRSRCSAACN
jgi:hypothetical protein